MVLTLYLDLFSQPTRSVYMFLKVLGIDFASKEISLFKGEHKLPEYLKKVPAGQVPAIDDNGFILTECEAILRYLAGKYDTTSAWYPKDLQARARADEYMSWQHTATRKSGLDYFIPKVLVPLTQPGTKPDEEKIKEAEAKLCTTLEYLEAHFLGNKQYLGGDHPTIADIMALTEIEQVIAGGYCISKHQKIDAWRKRMEAFSQLKKHFDEAHKILFQTCAKQVGKVM